MKNTTIMDLKLYHDQHPQLVDVLLNMNNDAAAMRQNVMKIADAYVRLVDRVAELMHAVHKLGGHVRDEQGKQIFDLRMTTGAQERARQLNIDVTTDPHMTGEADETSTSSIT